MNKKVKERKSIANLTVQEKKETIPRQSLPGSVVGRRRLTPMGCKTSIDQPFQLRGGCQEVLGNIKKKKQLLITRGASRGFTFHRGGMTEEIRQMQWRCSLGFNRLPVQFCSFQ